MKDKILFIDLMWQKNNFMTNLDQNLFQEMPMTMLLIISY